MSRIVVADGSDLRVHDLRSGRVTTLPPHPTRRLTNRHPTWSPDGTRVAWSAFDRRQPDSPAFVAIAGVSGGRVDHAVVFPAFYLHWRPDGAAVAALGEGPLGLELTEIDTRTGHVDIRTRGTPLFFDWSPDGTLCANIGKGREQRIELLDRRGVPDPFQSVTPAQFTAPAWRNRDELVLALQSEDHRLLAVVDRDANPRRVLAAIDGYARFAVTGDGRRLAWVSGKLAHLADLPVHHEGIRPGTRVAQPDQLVAHDLDTDTTHAVTDIPPSAFAWSPDGRSLLYCAVLERGEQPLLQWHVWCDGTDRAFARFRASALLARDYLPFAEQHARSMSWWSPDSGAFCYAGADLDDRDGVWVQPLDRAAERITSGQFAAWSPR